MPTIACPIAGCDYKTDDVEAAIVVELLRIHSQSHNSQPKATTWNTATSQPRLEKVKRPTISASGTSEDWEYFKTRWNEYVQSTKIVGKELTIQLLECCDEDLRKNMTRLAGGSLIDKDEMYVLSAIQKLAVRVQNVMVARVQLHDMKQDREEPVRNFCARISGQANICNYKVTCPGCDSGVDYTNHIVRDCVIRGISDDDIRLDVLGNQNQDMELETLLSFIESKESGKRSLAQLVNSPATNTALSQYRKSSNAQSVNKSTPSKLCQYCGTSGHGDGSNLCLRREKCTAYGQICTSCNRRNHSSSVCRSKNKTHQQPPSLSSPPHPTTDATFIQCQVHTNDVLGVRQTSPKLSD